ncbi:hypothetical protein ZWY2020_021238 [Hordeum vulgare]|nr:hypothetical protein ZWY2020_021238 [Hordeum vulgare]
MSTAASALRAATSGERASAGAIEEVAVAETAAVAAMTAAPNSESAQAAATSESNMQPMSGKEAKAMEHILPHEIIEKELEMHEAAEIEERREELSVEESDVEYQ